VVFPVQTVGPKAKELARRRLLADGGSRKSSPDRPCGPAGRARPRERCDRRSFSRGGDSGSDPDEPEPPPAGRLCACGCGRNLSHRAAQARYLNDAHAATDRQRRKRERDLLNGVPDLPELCRCTPKRQLVDGGVCVQCGHARGQLTDDWLAGPARSEAARCTRLDAAHVEDRRRQAPRGETAKGHAAGGGHMTRHLRPVEQASRARRLQSRRDPEAWVAERHRVLSADRGESARAE
jgi:hypothetical protein